MSDGAYIIVESAKELSCRSVNEEENEVCGGVIITVMRILTFTASTIFILIGQSCRCFKSSRKLLNCFCVYGFLNECKTKGLQYFQNYGTVLTFAWKWPVKW